MNKLASELVRKPVLVKQAIQSGEGALVGIVEDLIINPDNGELAGFVVREGFGINKLKTLGAKDVLGISSDFYLIPNYETLGEMDEIVRLKVILDKGVKIIGNKVFTFSGRYLGRVTDYKVDLRLFMISQIHVKMMVFGYFGKQHIIAYKQIISIEKDKIVVDDAFAKVRKATLVKAENTATI
jgi:sporulation protein YlmC with PRC-barrel domain